MPQGRHFAVTWSIPDDYGGMTAAMLARSSAFSRLGGTPVDVLTFDARPDTADLEGRLPSSPPRRSPTSDSTVRCSRR